MRAFLCFLLLLCFSSANECEVKIDKLKEELQYALKYDNKIKAEHLQAAISELSSKCKEDPDFYLKTLQSKKEKEEQIKALEKSLDDLDDRKDTLSKSEFKAQKEKLKAQKDLIKEELKLLQLY